MTIKEKRHSLIYNGSKNKTLIIQSKILMLIVTLSYMVNIL